MPRTMSRADHWTHVRSKLLVKKEIQHLWCMKVYEYFTEAEARARTGRNPAGLKWIATNRGSAEAPRYRSRLVCTEVRHEGVEPIFSATPACQEDVFRVEDLSPIATADVSRAHCYADVVRDVYVRLPDEDPKAKQPGVCGNGQRLCTGAAQHGRQHYAQVLEAGVFSRGVASPCHFFHKGLQTCVLVHGDEYFLIVGRREGRKYVLSLLRGAYELSKVVTLGPESSQFRTVSFLGGTLTLRQWRI